VGRHEGEEEPDRDGAAHALRAVTRRRGMSSLRRTALNTGRRPWRSARSCRNNRSTSPSRSRRCRRSRTS